MIEILRWSAAAGANGLLLLFLPRFFPGFILDADAAAIVVGAIVLTALNRIIKPALSFLTMPLAWMTLGLSRLGVNIIIMWLADYLLPQIRIADVPTLVGTSLIVSIVNFF
jgi:putative membrane protein